MFIFKRFGQLWSSIKITRFYIAYSNFEVLANWAMCDGEIKSMHRVDGIGGDVFLDEYHTVGNGTHKHIWKIDENYNISKIFDDIYWGERISVDFARTGYVRSSIGLYNFYDRNFNYRKQRYSDESHLMFDWRNTPFRKGFMLEYTADVLGSIEGIHLRLIDSNLHIKNSIQVLPPEGYNFGASYCTFNTGYSITPNDEIWFTGFFNVAHPLFNYATPYMITKVDSNLNIICQHFVIDENDNQVLGLRSFSSGEVAVFGKSRNRFEIQNIEEDGFLVLFGENCESPFTTRTEDSKDIISISAYPNPTVNDLTIRVSGMDESILRVEFFDRTGKTIDVHTNLTSSIQVHNYPPGQYFYRIMDEDRVLGVGSWVKQ